MKTLRLLSFILFCSFIVFGCKFEDNDRVENIERIRRSGIENLRKGDYSIAKIAFESILLLDKSNVEARGYLKPIYKHISKLAELFNTQGYKALQNGELNRAKDLFRRSLVLNPEYVEASTNLSIVEEEIEKGTVSDYPGDPVDLANARLTAAEAFFANRHYKLALLTTRDVLRKFPNSPVALDLQEKCLGAMEKEGEERMRYLRYAEESSVNAIFPSDRGRE